MACPLFQDCNRVINVMRESRFGTYAPFDWPHLIVIGFVGAGLVMVSIKLMARLFGRTNSPAAVMAIAACVMLSGYFSVLIAGLTVDHSFVLADLSDTVSETRRDILGLWRTLR